MDARPVGPESADPDNAIAIIAAARRPVVLAWRGGIAPEARAAVLRFAARIEAPVATTLQAKDLFNNIALRMAMVAADAADLVATVRWGNEWDIAAAALIVQEAGGIVTDALGDALAFNRPRPTAFGLLCAAPGIHGAAVERLTPRAREILGKD